MPDKPLTIATYAAGASLAAIALVYVFGPTYLFDQPDAHSPSRPVGLSNPANDCFINCILQATAGLPDLRKYLIREIHRRELEGPDVYGITEEDYINFEKRAGAPPWRLEGLRQGIVTRALKDVLDRLNERPIYRKTISAAEFIKAIETAYRTRISRQQQDAQEFLQVVLERLCDEYHAGSKARRNARKQPIGPKDDTYEATQELPLKEIEAALKSDPAHASRQDAEDDGATEDGFPFEGQTESHVECESCHFKPKPSGSSFVTLTLNVPQRSSTSLNECFDSMLKVEHIEDYICDRCRLEHAIHFKEDQILKCRDGQLKPGLQEELVKLRQAIENDPENPPKDVELPDSKLAPKRRISRHIEISRFPKVLAIHLSRSMYSEVTFSSKNTAKVGFPELLPLGSILNQRKYRLVSVVTHKGIHSNGHYETFRRQILTAPFSTPTSFGTTGVYSNKSSPIPSAIQSPRLQGQASVRKPSETKQYPAIISPSRDPSLITSPSLASPSTSPLSSRSSLSLSSSRRQPPTSAPRSLGSPSLNEVPASNEPSRPPSTSHSISSTLKSPSPADIAKMQKKQKKRNSRWWRISDDRVKECKVGEVLGMQKEVYLLFYELIEPEQE